MSKVKTFVSIHGEPIFDADFPGLFSSHVKQRYRERVFKSYSYEDLPPPEDRIEEIYRHYARSVGESWEYIARLAKIPGVEPSKEVLDDMGLLKRNCYYLDRSNND